MGVGKFAEFFVVNLFLALLTSITGKYYSRPSEKESCTFYGTHRTINTVFLPVGEPICSMMWLHLTDKPHFTVRYLRQFLIFSTSVLSLSSTWLRNGSLSTLISHCRTFGRSFSHYFVCLADKVSFDAVQNDIIDFRSLLGMGS